MKKLILLPLLLASFGASAACKPDISEAWIRLAPGGNIAAGYFRMDNKCAAPAVLNAAASPAFKSVSVHQTVASGGVSRMRHLPSLTVARNDRAIFAPGGLHIMLMQPTRKVKVGERVPVTVSGPGWSVTKPFEVKSAF